MLIGRTTYSAHKPKPNVPDVPLKQPLAPTNLYIASVVAHCFAFKYYKICINCKQKHFLSYDNVPRTITEGLFTWFRNDFHSGTKLVPEWKSFRNHVNRPWVSYGFRRFVGCRPGKIQNDCYTNAGKINFYFTLILRVRVFCVETSGELWFR